jgi:hypothetical protein
VTLGGQVASENDKSQAESLAKSLAGAQVVANQIAVIPVGVEKEAKAVNSDLDQGIEKNLHAALIQNRLQKIVKYDVKNGVVTLTREVNSQPKRALAEQIASAVPNVKQVVNDLQIKNQKASSLNRGQWFKTNPPARPQDGSRLSAEMDSCNTTGASRGYSPSSSGSNRSNFQVVSGDLSFLSRVCKFDQSRTVRKS